MRVLAVILCVASGCGRFGFDASPTPRDDARRDGRAGDAPLPDARCSPPGPSCWDVSATFTASSFAMDPSQLQVFGAPVGNNQVVYALFDGSDDNTYTEVNPYDCPPYYTGAIRAKAWSIERKRIDAVSYRLLVRGNSDVDCNRGQPISAGHIDLNPASGWAIAAMTSCSVITDTMNSNNTLISTFCTVDAGTGTIAWQSGSTCGGCCACADGAAVGIDVTVAHP